MSTLCQPSARGYFAASPDKPWGLISLDWSVAQAIWRQRDPMRSTCEGTTVDGCRMIKAVSPQTRCFIYHNMELALQPQETQRSVMYDQRLSGYFLQYTDGRGRKNGTIYNEPFGPGDQYFWDFRNLSAANYYVSALLHTVRDQAVDGTFTDDVTGFPEEHGGAPENINMSAADVEEVQYCTRLTHARLVDLLVSAGKYNWQAFGAQDGVGPGLPNQPDSCTQFMRERCTPEWQRRAITMLFDSANPEQSVAAFLITRPPIAYLGFGWESDMSNWNPIFLLQVGEPSGLCAEVGPGLFTRTWTYGNITLDCNAWRATIPHRDSAPKPRPVLHVMPLLNSLVEKITGLSGDSADATPSGLISSQARFSSTSRGTAWTTINGGFVMVPPSIGFLPTSYSVMFWVLVSSFADTNQPAIFVAGGSPGVSTLFFTQLTPSYQLGFTHGPSPSVMCTYQLDPTKANNTWMHVGVTFNATTRIASLYINGSLLNRTYNNPPWDGTSQIQLGYLQDSHSFLGWMQWLMWSNFELLASQVHAIYLSESKTDEFE